MEVIGLLLMLIFSIAALRFYDRIRDEAVQAEKVEKASRENPRAFRQCVETRRNTPIDITLHGKSFIQNPLWYCTISIPRAGVLVDEGEAILIEPTVLKHQNILRYTPENEFIGIDRFHFVVYDGEFSQSAYVVIKVTDRRPSMSASNRFESKRRSNRKPAAWHTFEKELQKA